MRFGAKSARALSTFRHFSCITTLFSSNGWCRVSFSGCFFWWIHLQTKKYNQVQKVRAHKSTFRHLCAFSYETYTFFQVAVHGCQFWVIFDGEFIPIVKNPIGCKKCAGTQHFQALVCIFMYSSIQINWPEKITQKWHPSTSISGKMCRYTWKCTQVPGSAECPHTFCTQSDFWLWE